MFAATSELAILSRQEQRFDRLWTAHSLGEEACLDITAVNVPVVPAQLPATEDAVSYLLIVGNLAAEREVLVGDVGVDEPLKCSFRDEATDPFFSSRETAKELTD